MRTSVFSNGIIWFGVAISVSEIEAGIEIGSAAASDSLWLPLVLGHLLGGVMLFFVGLIGARVRLNAMETTASTFGKYGSKFFAALNVFQLLAWVAVLNAQGASALSGLNLPISFPLTCVILAVLIAAWVYVGLKRSANVATVVMAALAILLAVLSVKLFGIAPASGAKAAAVLGFWNDGGFCGGVFAGEPLDVFYRYRNCGNRGGQQYRAGDSLGGPRYPGNRDRGAFDGDDQFLGGELGR